jgi:hypothetical protein
LDILEDILSAIEKLEEKWVHFIPNVPLYYTTS